MRTTATNKKIRVLLRSLSDGSLKPDPSFQRRLVWSNKHKIDFLETVLRGYPFPEIYIAAGSVDPDTAEGLELVVDGQQRLTTLKQYFDGSPELRYENRIQAYEDLTPQQKLDFLEYEVVVRDLGAEPIEEIKEVFRRINSTKYSLNAMEVHNARYEGAFKKFCEELAQDPFFESNRVFHTNEIRRMSDTRFAVEVVATLLAGYFDRDSETQRFLEQYNDDFPQAASLRTELAAVFEFVSRCELPRESRAWKKADLFTLLVELYRVLIRDRIQLDAKTFAGALMDFYARVEKVFLPNEARDNDATTYYLASLSATNDKMSRIRRGEAMRNLVAKINAQPNLPMG